MSEELTKEQKLEAAKKKCDALKKKSKKKNKKSKKTEETATEGEETRETTEEPEDSKTDNNEDEENDKEEENATGEGVTDEGKVEASEDLGELKQATKEVDTKESMHEELKEEAKDASKQTEEVTEKAVALDTSKPDDVNQLENKSPSKDETKDTRLEIAEEQVHDNTVDSLFPESNQSFLDTLKIQDVEPVNPEIMNTGEAEAIALENQGLLKENEVLKKELRSLKLLKIEHLDQIETLKQKVQELEARLNKQSIDMPQSYNQQLAGVYDEDNFTLSPTPSYQQPTYNYEQQQHFHANMTPFSSDSNIEQIKASLERYKGWNVDMTNWRSIGEGSIVKL